MKYLLVYLLVYILFYSCQNRSENDEHLKNVINTPIDSTKLTNKEVIYLLMQNNDVLLDVDSSCHDISAEPGDSTIGQYLSSFWQYHTDTIAHNSINIKVVEGDAKDLSDKHWKVYFMLRERDEEDLWSWGVSFLVTKKDKMAVRKSFQCLGAG